MALLRSLYGLTIFLSAFLLFVVEPMAAKQLLPTLGGSSAVWTTCLVFFSVMLLLGYLYAHWISTNFQPIRQAILHIVLLTAALLTLGAHVRPGPTAVSYHPAVTVFRVLATVIGLPYLALSATTPLLTAWYAGSFGSESPYRLFALSNLASLLALGSYPLLIEPRLTMRQQTGLWSGGFLLFAVLCGAIAWQGRRRVAPPMPEPAALQGHPEPFWFLLALGGGMLLTAVTSHMSANIAAIPLLWLPPLALYLLTFILAFQGAWLPVRQSMLRFVLVAVASMAYMLRDIRTQLPIAVSVPLFLIALFIVCFFLHGELYARRPATAGMTRFYLVAAAGGAAGTLLVGVVAPLVLRANYDLACTLVVVALIAMAATWQDGWGLRMLWVVGAAAAIVVLSTQVRQYDDDAVSLMRNFYGTLRVRETHLPPQSDTDRQLLNGTIEHGAEWFAPQFLGQPLTYYATNSGLGLAMRLCCGAGPKRVGVIGLGTGTVAAYGNAGDVMRFYEINPPVERLARHWFTFLHDSGAKIDVVLGDARLSLASEPPQNFNVMVVDAFSGDAIPVHLLTREALALYRRHLRPDGIIVFHVSNQYIDLEPVVAGIANNAGLNAVSVHTHADEQTGLYYADWILVTANQAFLHQPEIVNNGFQTPLRSGVRLWTDNYSSVFPLLKWQSR
ncbi:MAG: fused MFS/spermidine synthase [Acidobacteriaceae bacterium]